MDSINLNLSTSQNAALNQDGVTLLRSLPFIQTETYQVNLAFLDGTTPVVPAIDTFTFSLRNVFGVDIIVVDSVTPQAGDYPYYFTISVASPALTAALGSALYLDMLGAITYEVSGDFTTIAPFSIRIFNTSSTGSSTSYVSSVNGLSSGITVTGSGSVSVSQSGQQITFYGAAPTGDYYPNSNPSGFITTSALAPYATSANLAATGGVLATGKEPAIPLGYTSQYFRGDKSWQILDANAVGLGNVENTALSSWGGSTNVTTIGTLANLTVYDGTQQLFLYPYGFTLSNAGNTVTYTTVDPVSQNYTVYLPTDGTILTDASSLNWAQISNVPANISSLAGANLTNTIYYRNAGGSWGGVSIGSGLSFSAGSLALQTGYALSSSLAATGSNLQGQINTLTSHTGDYYPRTNPTGYITSSALTPYLQAKKYSAYIGDGTSTGISVHHNLGTQDVFVSLYETGNGQQMVLADIYNTGTNSLLLGFATAPAVSGLRVVVIG